MIEMHEKLKALSASHDPGHLDDLKHSADVLPHRPVTPMTEAFKGTNNQRKEDLCVCSGAGCCVGVCGIMCVYVCV